MTHAIKDELNCVQIAPQCCASVLQQCMAMEYLGPQLHNTHLVLHAVTLAPILIACQVFETSSNVTASAIVHDFFSQSYVACQQFLSTFKHSTDAYIM